MTAIPLPTGCRGKKDSYKQKERLINCYFKPGDIGTILPRPGVAKVKQGIGRCRGKGKFKDELYQVSNDQLIKITVTDNSKKLITDSDVVVDTLGTIDGTADCVLVAGFTNLCILVKGGAAYVYNDTLGLREITDPSYLASDDVAYDGGRFVFVPSDGGPFFWSELNNPASINPQAYADAEEFPDLNKAVQYYSQAIDILGSRSIERLDYDVTQSSYVRISGTVSTKTGYIGGKTDYGATYAFIGIEDGGYGIYVMGQAPQHIANDYIDELLNVDYTELELSQCVATTFRWQGQNIALFQLERHTIALYPSGNGLDMALWHSGTTGNETGTLRWGFTESAYGYIWTGDFSASNIGILTDDTIEYENDIESAIYTFIRSQSRSRFSVNRVYCACTTGQSNAGYRISAKFSRDGVTFGNEVWRTLGREGFYGQEVSWGPIGRTDNYLGIRLAWIGQISLNIDGLYFD